MNESGPLLTSSSAMLWLKVLLTVGLLGLLCFRYASRNTPAAKTSPVGPIMFAVVFSAALFYSFGHPRSGSFVHYGEMFHYYLGPKYFEELGHYRLYDAVIAADAEQDAALAGLPFYTDLRTYQNASRETALAHAEDVKKRFSEPRWSAFKGDVAFFKEATGMPRTAGIAYFVMDHGYNASPVSTLMLGAITNIVPVTQLTLLASLDVLLVAAMIGLVFRTFGLLTGGLFSVYFFVNILNDFGYISGSLLRYDWLLCVVAAVCLLEKKRHASSAVFLTVAAMLKVFPALLFYGIGVSIVQRVKTARALDGESRRFVLASVATALVLFLLPAVYLGSVWEPWREFGEKTALHDRGVYVNHLGLRGILLFEPSHLSLDSFAETFNDGSGDIVRHWQDVKEHEFEQKRPLAVVCALVVLALLTAIIWKRRAPDTESVLWPLLLIYVTSYPSHYYYAFLCLLILLFFRRPNSLAALVPLCLLLVFNVATLVTDSFSPSPIVFYTLVNLYLFVCVAAILGYELYDAFRPVQPVVEAPVAIAKKRVPGKKKSRVVRRITTAAPGSP